MNFLAKVILVIGLGMLAAFVVVRLTVTREGVVVPDVVGKDVVAALEVVNKHELGLKIIDRSFHVSAPTNQIVSQEPRAGSWMKAEGIIRVVVSKGAGEAVVPAVQGMPWREAKATLERYSLRVGEVIRIHADRVPRDMVIAHNPPREAKIIKGGPVTLLVSEGSRSMTYVMPDLRGHPQHAANEIVTSLGLRVEKVSYRERPEARAGSVIEQRPTAGGPVTVGQGVEFVLAKRETTPAGSIGTFTLFQHHLPRGQGSRRVQIVVVNADESRQVFDEVRSSGDEVRVLVRVKGETMARVYYDGLLVEERRIE